LQDELARNSYHPNCTVKRSTAPNAESWSSSVFLFGFISEFNPSAAIAPFTNSSQTEKAEDPLRQLDRHPAAAKQPCAAGRW
jgi:hypothetical protein